MHCLRPQNIICCMKCSRIILLTLGFGEDHIPVILVEATQPTRLGPERLVLI